MKKITKIISGLTFSSALLLSSLNLQAEVSTNSSISLDVNSHFMSYGADVWAAGTSPDALFQPSASFGWDFDSGLSLYTGVWADVNDKANSSLGGDIQEIDVWVGAAYSFDSFTIDVAFQQWYFSGETEGILDVSLSYDTTFSPYVLLHTRVEGVGTQETGSVLEIGGSQDLEGKLGEFSFSVPAAVGLFLEDKYQGGDDIFGYAKTGIDFSAPLTCFPEGAGEWDVHGGIGLWHTPKDAVPGNPDETFLTYSLGVGCAF